MAIDTIKSTAVLDGAIATADIADDAVTSAKINYPLTTFSSTGIDDNADALAMTIDSSERVLVGTTNAVIVGNGGVALKGADGRIDASGGGGPAALLDRRTNDGDIVGFYKAGSQIGSISVMSGDNLAIASTSADHAGLMLGGHSIIPMEANAQADGTINLGSSTKRFQNLILSGGVKLGGTGTANTLDDYEEGTATVTMNGGSAHPASRLQTTAYYTKIGSLVNINFEFNNVNTASYGGYISVFGLPFAASSPGGTVTRQVCGQIAVYGGATFSSDGGIFGRLNEGATEIILWNNGSNTAWEQVTHNAGTGRYLIMNITYRTDS